MRRIIDICWRLCKQVPLLPITILSAIPLALLGEWKPWGEAAWDSWISQVGVDGLSAFNPGVGQWIVIALVAYTIVVTVRGMIDDLRHGHVGVDLLAVVAIASTVAVQEYWAAWAVVLMISSGEAIEEFAQSKAESNLTALIDAAPRTAHVVVLPGMRGHVHASGSEHTADVTADGFRTVRVSDSGETDNQDGEKRAFASESPETDTKGAAQTYDAAGERFETVPVDQVQLGDVILVLPGETVPVDGELLSGVATLDLSNINGEPVPREVYAGARVMSGAVNGSTTLTMRATQLAHDSQYQKILELVSSAQESRPAVVKTADMLAVPFTVLSLAIAGIAWAISGLPLRFAQVLVLATPCPLLIAAPVAYVAGTGRLAKAGILIKAQDVLENLGRVSHIFFDKTGTLTVKQPQVVRVEKPFETSSPFNEDHILMMASVVEGYSVHILSKGIAAAGRKAMDDLYARYAAGQRLCVERDLPGHGRDYPVVKNIVEESGKGISGEVNGHQVRVGRFAYVTADESGFMPVLHMPDATYYVSDSAESDKRETQNALRMSDSPETDTMGVRNGVPDDAQPAAAPSTSASVATQSAARKPETANSLFAPLAPDEMAAYVAIDGRLAARIVLRDVPRENAKRSLARLHELGVKELSMLTGDKAASARIIANEVGIDDVQSELFPEDKVAAVKSATESKHQKLSLWNRIKQRVTGESKNRQITMMVGDGVNDAPVLAVADIGMAMTDGTSTAASESAQVVIMNDDIASVPRAIAIARRTKKVMLQAVLIGLGLAIIGMIAAAFNLIPVVVGAFMQEAIDVVSILWALTVLFDRGESA
ncbi:HAD-IC family P-type ATPase [Bifidobacterium pseudocatenulatum]|uniref:HAD-IC family P-type ATPase n=1 Tax=Bifidobacterium TaxID=1678 RepID=UPI001CFA3D7F|nr:MULTISPECIES: HAD-IC family P-type ATPase [Bifidobacterium]MCB4882913.1 HAD-IC family P-type ATPase [Bifidobacterium pseudocatenulatum]MCB4888239.1 HAD-IC family P-type ATPase [Bifidobacterium pseudocatenulatum]MCB4906354.1 HAD-IC family P-type ATPase [Bifidobacterium pseudocatenulatum]MDR3860271.1 HAD-IC family P-type ATPase [Bifidobacterium sp.]